MKFLANVYTPELLTSRPMCVLLLLNRNYMYVKKVARMEILHYFGILYCIIPKIQDGGFLSFALAASMDATPLLKKVVL